MYVLFWLTQARKKNDDQKKIARTSQNYGIEGFKGDLNWAPIVMREQTRIYYFFQFGLYQYRRNKMIIDRYNTCKLYCNYTYKLCV